MAAKIQAAQVQYQRGANPKWECLSNGEMKEHCKTAKDFGRRSPNFNNVFSATLTMHVLVPMI